MNSFQPQWATQSMYRAPTAPEILSQNNVYGNTAYTSNGYVQPYCDQGPPLTIPMSPPPPPYDAYRNDYDYGQQASRAFYLQPVQSQQQVHVPTETIASPEERLRRKASAWASTLDLSQIARNGNSKQQAWQSSVDISGPPLPMRPFAKRFDCPLVQAMSQGAALCDRVAYVAARVNDVFSSIDDQETDSDVELATTRSQMIIEEGKASKSMVDFRKTWQYQNSRLPPFMLPMKIYMRKCTRWKALVLRNVSVCLQLRCCARRQTLLWQVRVFRDIC